MIWKGWWCKSNLYLFFLGFVLFVYIAIRVNTVCFSDDEYMTYTLFVKQSWWDILVSNCGKDDWEPNNHVLNSIFMKIEMLSFGAKDWALRLHSLFFWIIFYFYASRLVQLFTPSFIRQICYIVILLVHQYILDFFGLARGYAISMAGVMGTLYYYRMYIQTPHISFVYKFCIGLFLAIWANFSAMYFILFFLPMMVLQIYKTSSKAIFEKQVYILYIFLLLVLLLCGVPMYKSLRSPELFGGATGIFQDCIVSFINQCISHDSYIDRHYVLNNNWRLIEVLGIAFLIFWISLQVFSLIIKSAKKQLVFHRSLLFFLLFCVIIFKLLFVVNHTPIPAYRTLLIFSIPFFCSVCLAFEIIILHNKWWVILLYTCTFFILVHFAFCANLLNTIEWWQNGDAKKITTCIKKNLKLSNNQLCKIGAESWQYHSMAFYIETQLPKNAEIYWTDLTNLKLYNYLVIPNQKHNIVEPQYQLLQKFDKCSVYLPKKQY